MHDGTGVGKLSHSVPISELDLDAVDVLFMCGGHGTCTDFVSQPSLKEAIENCFRANKLVAAVCHGPMCLADCVKEDGKPLVEGLKVTGFSNTEEEVVQLTGVVPFLLENKLKELGGIYERAEDWNSKVVVDGNLVTGQNPQSSDACAAACVELLG